ncbi:unnamed protein product [Linum trigynum]|uniref:Transposase MuDR plant domain-containing protein n=1 Tax=Linum trigynum TaxID=586398 RepID=A0AAV2CF85_9ROSI
MGGEDEEAEDIPHVQTEQVGNQTLPEAEDIPYERTKQVGNQTLPESEYRASVESRHVRGNLDEEPADPIYDGPHYDPRCEHSTLKFMVGMSFNSPEQFKEAVEEHSIAIGGDIKWTRSDKNKKRAECRQKCGWYIYGSWHARSLFMVKNLGKDHTCPRAVRMRVANATWVAKKYIERFRREPYWKVKYMMLELRQTHNVVISRRQYYRARTYAKRMLGGSLIEEYNKIRRYVGALKERDRDGTFILEVDPSNVPNRVLFKRLYIGFSGLRRGFIRGCRPMFALDGCFLKGEVKGMLLSAVGKDRMFPIAWAVVEGESSKTWNWFVSILQQDLRTIVVVGGQSYLTSIRDLCKH